MKKVEINNTSSGIPTPNGFPGNMNGMPPTEGMGNMFGNMMGGMPPINNIPNDNIIDSEVREIVEPVTEETPIEDNVEGLDIVTEDTPIPPAVITEPEEPFIVAKTATPFNISINEKNGKKVATVYFLCRDEDDKLFLIDRNLILDNEEDELTIEALPFTEDKEADFASERIVAHSLNAYLPSYITDMQFYVDEGFEKDLNPTVYLYGTDINTRASMKIKMTADIFSCMNFVDSYIFDGVDCEHDLALATVAGSKVIDSPAQFFLVDKVDSIVSMANAVVDPERKGLAKLFKKKKAKKDPGTTIGLVVKVDKFISNTEKEVVSILISFDAGVTFDESKYRGKTIDQIQSEYYGDSDQFVATLTTMNTRLHGVDKEYMIIRGKSKDKKVRLFLFDSSMQEELKHLIDIY